jgi:hypothetical protein
MDALYSCHYGTFLYDCERYGNIFIVINNFCFDVM